jgi:hypothetical protein
MMAERLKRGKFTVYGVPIKIIVVTQSQIIIIKKSRKLSSQWTDPFRVTTVDKVKATIKTS